MFVRRTTIAATMSIILLGLLGTSFFALSPTPALAQQNKPSDDRAVTVDVDAVIEEQARQNVPVIGRLVAQNSGVVSAIIKGAVQEMRVHVGDRVDVGDVLAVLASDSLKWSRELRVAEVKSAEADLTNARAQAKLRRQELQRLENLRQSSAFSPARFEDAQQELAKAESSAARGESDLSVAKANLNLADIDLANAQVKAPYAGVVTATLTAVGTYLNAGEPVLSLVDDLSMEVEADVPADRVQALTPGTMVSFGIGADGVERFAAVRAQVPEENPLTRTRKVRFSPAEDALGQNAAANQSVSIAIPSGPMKQVITVHKDAVLTKGGQRVVFLVTDGKAELRPVELGEAVGGRFIVHSGLKSGDEVVVRGNERLAPGQTVQTKKTKK
ncbi:MAG: efflux RND transporter periplasmic adaptor subunit [Rhodospirillales bacterium]|nr:efflux RND transporter periplasmic adaptor subunit [Rhodospirillales bacterium]